MDSRCNFDNQSTLDLAYSGPATSSTSMKSCPTSGDIFQKINALLDNNKMEFVGSLLDMDSAKPCNSITSPSCTIASQLSPNSNVFYPSASSASLAGYENESRSLSSILGLSAPEPHNGRTVRTFQCGEFKFPDATSPLHKILSEQSATSSSNSRNRFPSSPFGLSGFGSLGESKAQMRRQVLSGSVGSDESRSPRLTDDNFLFGSSKFEFARSESPETDLGYGTSYGSVLSSTESKHGRDERDLNELLKCLNVSSQGTSPVANRLTTANNSMNTGLGDDTSSVAHIVRNLHALQQQQTVLQNLHNLHSLNQLMGTVSPGGSSTCSSLDFIPNGNGNGELERAARMHRNGTAVYDASCTWSGQLPPRNMRNLTLSCKVFLGGVPWDITETTLVNTFKSFGNIRIEWPGKDTTSVPKGYLYVIFENEKQVKSLLNACTQDYSSGGSWYFKISSRRMRNKEVQVIPWVITDSNYVRCPSQRLDPQKTVFVGALHGMLTAEALCNIFNDLFGGVVYAGIDTDKYKYPLGSGRVTFNNQKSFLKAVSAAFIEIKTPKFSKKVQVDPYLEDALCSSCGLRQGPYFCRDVSCFKYFCRSCWEVDHTPEALRQHKPLMRNNRSNSGHTLGASMRLDSP